MLILYSFWNNENIIIYRIFQTFDTQELGSDPRIDKWIVIIKQLFSNFIYVIFGLGLGNSGTSGLEGNYIIIENSFLSVMYELGIIGLFFFVAFLMRFLINSLTLIRHNNSEQKSFGLAGVLFFSVFFFSSLFMDSYLNNPFNFYFWLFYALLEINIIKSRSVEKQV